VVLGSLHNQVGDEGAEQGFAASARVVHKLEEAGVSRTHPGVVQSGQFMGYTESGQSRANQGAPRFACNPDLNHAPASACSSPKRTGRYGNQATAGCSTVTRAWSAPGP